MPKIINRTQLMIFGLALVATLMTSCGLKEWANSGTYPLDMRTEYKQFNPETKKFEWVERQWRLDIPRAYIMKTRGRNGLSRSSPNRDYQNPFYISLSTQIDTDTMELRPNPYKGQAGHMSHRIDIHLSNGRPIPELRKAGESERACLSVTEMSEITGSPEPAAGRCRPTQKLCTMSMFVEGWPVRMSISRDFYKKPQPYCRAVREFLNGRTIKRDDQAATTESIKRDYQNKLDEKANE